LAILSKFEAPATPEDIARIDKIISDVARICAELEKWYKEG